MGWASKLAAVERSSKEAVRLAAPSELVGISYSATTSCTKLFEAAMLPAVSSDAAAATGNQTPVLKEPRRRPRPHRLD